ncbi:MAG: histidine phosphatase family protein [Cocleimonas sp.]|nr:histidine phosphatase family protein [Cocleimonas sp.]
MSKIIYLARHAKSSWDSGAATDYDRPLSNRGVADAVRMGDELQRLGWKPERVISSPAIRAKQTCQTLCDKLDFPFDGVVWNKDIYAAYVVTLLHSLSALPESSNSVMLMGHNPSMEDLLLHFCSDANAFQQENGKLFTTGNIAKITVDAAWKDLTLCEAKLEEILRPKEL